MVVCDDDFKVIFEGYKPKNREKWSWSVFSFSLTFQKEKYLIIGKQWHTACEYREYFLGYFVWDQLCTYTQRRRWGEYDYLSPNLHQYENHIRIIIPHMDMTNLNQDFFEHTKNHLIHLLKNNYYKHKFFMNRYIYDVDLSREEAIVVLQKFTRSKFQKICKW
jgi:hypothetical protein